MEGKTCNGGEDFLQQDLKLFAIMILLIMLLLRTQQACLLMRNTMLSFVSTKLLLGHKVV